MRCVCVCCACVRENFPRFFAGRRKSKQAGSGGEAGTGRKGQLGAFALKANCQRHLTKIFSYARAIVGPFPFTELPCSSFLPTFPLIPLHSCYLPHSVLPSNLAAFYHKVKVTFRKSAQRERNHIHTHSASHCPPLFLSLSLSPLSRPSLCHTHVNTFSHRLVAFALFLLLLLFLLCIFLSFSFCL